ncbi:MAG TPA: hypothetical protein VGB55_15370, partial [Tepidisphaeraceae bacterium]
GESMAGAFTDASGQRRLRSMGTMSYAGLKSFIYAGVSKSDPRVRAAWQWINSNFTLDAHPGMAELGEQEGQWGLFYYYMTVGKTLRAYGAPMITLPTGKKVDWRIAVIDKAAALQREDGSWIGADKYMENNPVLVTSYILLAVQDAKQDLKDHPAP